MVAGVLKDLQGLHGIKQRMGMRLLLGLLLQMLEMRVIRLQAGARGHHQRRGATQTHRAHRGRTTGQGPRTIVVHNVQGTRPMPMIVMVARGNPRGVRGLGGQIGKDLFGLFVDGLDQRGDLLFFFELRVAADQQRNVILQQRTDNSLMAKTGLHKRERTYRGGNATLLDFLEVRDQVRDAIGIQEFAIYTQRHSSHHPLALLTGT